MGQGGGHGEPERARPDHGDHIPLANPGPQDGVHGAGHRFGGDGVGVAEPVGDGEELARMCHQAGGRPPTPGVGAEPCLQPGPDVAERHALTVTDVPGCTRTAERVDAAGGTTQYRLEHHAGAGGQRFAVRAHGLGHEVAHHLVTRDKGE